MTKGEAIRIVEELAAHWKRAGGNAFATTSEQNAIKRLLQEVKRDASAN